MTARTLAASAWVIGALVCARTHAPAGPAANDLVARGTRGAVTSAEPQATRVGLEVLQRGGNAVDAAVATFLALAVTHPQAGNLGGGGFFVIRMADGRCTTIDFRERAPRRATAEMFVKPDGSVDTDKSRHGALAAGVPGSPAGLLLALERFGSRPLTELAAPAIALARDGFVVDSFLARDFAADQKDLARFPSNAGSVLRPATDPLKRVNGWCKRISPKTLRPVPRTRASIAFFGVETGRSHSLPKWSSNGCFSPPRRNLPKL